MKPTLNENLKNIIFPYMTLCSIQLFWNVAEHKAVILPGAVQKFKIIG